MTTQKRLGGFVLAMAMIAASAISGGCASIVTSKVGSMNGITIKGAAAEPREHVWLETSGSYLFCTIPLGSGKFYWDEHTKKLETGTVLFEDCVGIAELQDALTKYADSHNCDLADVAFYDSDSSYADASSYEGIIGLMFNDSCMGVSAVLIPRKQPAGLQ